MKQSLNHRKRPRPSPLMMTTSGTKGKGLQNGHKAASNMAVLAVTLVGLICFSSVAPTHGFMAPFHPMNPSHVRLLPSSIASPSTKSCSQLAAGKLPTGGDNSPAPSLTKWVASIATTAFISASFLLHTSLPALAENELSAKYGGRGFDSSLVDQTCLVDHCSLQAKACLADDPSCRKGLTCTAKCLGDNACITGCMAQYGNNHLDDLLKCTIEDHECIKVAILDGGADKYGEEPRSPAPTIRNFQMASLEGTWYKVMGYNPNYDCYACQRNTFASPAGKTSTVTSNAANTPQTQFVGLRQGVSGYVAPGNDRLEVDVDFSMPRLLPDGSPPPPSGTRETIQKATGTADLMYGSQSVGYNDYHTHELMVFDTPEDQTSKFAPPLVLAANAATGEDAKLVSYARTAHSQGEMFGLKFWENWYVIGENDPGEEEFKFIYYNGKTRQNTYEGAFVYSRSPMTTDMNAATLKKVYQIASTAGMNPDQFCRIHNGCFEQEAAAAATTAPTNNVKKPGALEGLGSPSNPFRPILASTTVSRMLGVEPVAAESVLLQQGQEQNLLLESPALSTTAPSTGSSGSSHRHWWQELGDYLEDPHRHFRAMDSLRRYVEWPEEIKQQK